MPAQKFEHTPTVVEAIQYDGSAASGREIVAWTFAHRGEANYRQAEEAYESADGRRGRLASAAELCVITVDGPLIVPAQSWVLFYDYRFFVHHHDEMMSLYRPWDPRRLPKRIVLDYESKTLLVDGRQFAYPVSDEVPVETRTVFGQLQVMRIPVLAREVLIIGAPPT